jgi:UDP-glucose:(heptosyl)LPS alpha-1,3-glucosyltransferase
VPERLRIALLIDRFGRRFGGAEAYGVNLFEVLSRRHDVTVIAHDFEHDLPVQQIKVKVSRKWPSWLRVWLFARQAKRLTREGFDVVHSHMNGGVGQIHVIHVAPIRYRRLNGMSAWQRFVVYLQPSNVMYLWLEAAAMRVKTGSRVVAVSPWLKERIHDSYGKQLVVDTIAPGALSVVVDPLVRAQMRAALGWADDAIGCLLVARNPLRKGLATVLEALSQLPENFRLAVVGTQPEIRDYLQVNYPKLMARVNLIVPTSDVSPYYQAADVYVHPTLIDSFGMAPLEAMAHGLPVIVSGPKFCGFGQYVTHRHDAWVLTNPEDPHEIAQGLRALTADPVLRAHLLHHAAELVGSLSWAAAAQKYEALYTESIEARRFFTPSRATNSQRAPDTL